MSVPAAPQYFRVASVFSDESIGVDRESRVIRGYVVAEEGPTKTPGRAEFDQQSLEMLMQLGNESESGVKSHFQHANASDDGLGKFVGRAKNFRLDQRNGRMLLRADMHIDKTAMDTPPGGGKPYGEYLMDLAESDAGAMQTSIVIPSGEKLERDPDGNGNSRPPLIRPSKFIGTDFVQEGDAVHGDLFSVESLDAFMEGSDRRIPTKLAIAGAQYLDQMFPDADRDIVAARIEGFKTRYLNLRFGAASTHEGESVMDQDTKDAIEALQHSTDEKLSKLTEIVIEDRKERKEQLSAQARAAGITAACEMSGVAKRGEAATWIADEKFTLENVREELFSRLCKKNAPIADDSQAADEFSTPPVVDENAAFREEYAAHKKIHEALGVSEARYIQRRRKEEKLPEQTTLVSA